MKKDSENEGYRIPTAGKFPAIKSIDTVALYDEKTKFVVHLHEVVTFEGAKVTTIEEAQTDALDYAKRLGCNVELVKTIHVANFQANAAAYIVNLKSKTLEPMRLPIEPINQKK